MTLRPEEAMRAAAERVAHAKATGDPARAGPKHRFSPAYVANLARVGAKYLLGIEGKGEQADLLRAFLFFKQAAQFGHVGANYELGVMYREVYSYNNKKKKLATRMKWPYLPTPVQLLFL